MRSLVSFLLYIAAVEASPHPGVWTEMEQSWKDWASVGVPLHLHVAAGWSPPSPLSVCLQSCCWPLMGSSPLAHPRCLFIWKSLGQWEARILGEGSALGSGHSPYLLGWEFWAQTDYWLMCLGLSLSRVHSLLPSVAFNILVFTPKYLIAVSGYYWSL